jgi:hypothetical protein
MTKSAIVVMCLLFTIFLLSHCKTKDQQFYLRMQLVDFANYKQIRIIEDTIHFNAKDIETAFINGNKIAKEQMLENKRKNVETYYFEIKNLKNENLLKFVSENIKLKYMISNTNNNRIKKINLIID